MSDAIENRVLNISREEAVSIRQDLIANSQLHFVEIDGCNIKSWDDYISEIQVLFRFPTPCNDSVDRYPDWIRDLDWLGKEGYVLIINHFDQFIKDNPKLRNEIISDFEELILPFWEDEVTRVVVEGKAKPFMVYLVH